MCFNENDCGPDAARRAFIAGTVGLAVSGMASPAFAQSAAAPQPATTPPPTRVLDDPRVTHGPVTFTHNGKPTIGGYLARPKAEGIYPGVLVIAGNRISEEYIPNTCAALALAGFVGLAPDVFHVLPDTAETLDAMRAASANHTDDDVLQDVNAGLDYLRTQKFVRPAGFGVVGFCFGGRMALTLGARSREIDAVVAYHPGLAAQLAATDLSRLRSPVLIHNGTKDGNVSVAEIKTLEARLKKQRTPTQLYLYEGANHGFLAYTRPPRYDPKAGALSWERTVTFLKKTLA